MGLTAGDRLGPYEITARIGRGGMGEVYQATDTNLKRQVAIKVLPDAVASDAERLARFQREAEVLATLNHRNIATIHGLEKTGSGTALVMELVEGPTLADRIAGGPLPLDDVCAIAQQIAEALEAAHAQGIIHRDLKPANVKVRPDGTVKVLDFGLAKAMDLVGDRSASQSMSPTLTTPAVTGAGFVLGTAAYMSPEQARGQATDRRADIWSFGCVLYEMLTGARAFDAEDVSLTLAEVLKSEPELARLPADTPEAVRRLVRRCLRKKPGDRLHDIADARLEIADALAEPAQTGSEEASTPAIPGGRYRLALGTAAVLAVALLAVAWYAFGLRSAPADSRKLRASILLPDGLELALSSQVGVPTSLLVSPDGRRLAVIARDAEGKDQILVRGVDSPTFQPLTGTEGTTSMFWSADSEQLAFVAGDTLRRIAVSGGPPASIVPISGIFGGGTWNQDGTIVLSMASEGGGYSLMRVPAGGGDPRDVLELSPGQAALRPAFLPDGEHVVFTGLAFDDTAADLVTQGIPMYVASLDGTDAVRLGLSQSTNVQYAQGHLLFLRERTLMAWPFDADRLETTGDAIPIAEDVESHGSTPPYGLFSASQEGLLVYRSGASFSGDTRRLTWLDRAGAAGETVGPPASYISVRLSPDGERAAVAVGALAEADVHVVDLARGVDTPVTFRQGMELLPTWSPDGSRFAFAAGTIATANLRLFFKASDGTGDETRLQDDDESSVPFDWVGDLLLYGTLFQTDVRVLSLSADAKSYPLLDSEFGEGYATVSPDGRWMAYVSDEAGDPAVYVTRFTGERVQGKIRVSSAGGGVMPRWRGDGRELFFYAPEDDALMAVAFDGTNDARPAGVAQPLFQFGRRLFLAPNNMPTYDVTADGQNFLAVLTGEEARSSAAPITVIANWATGTGH